MFKKSKNDKFLKRIVIDPGILGGKPVIRGTRMPVEQILRLLAEGLSAQEIKTDFPQITAQDILASLNYASYLVEDFQVYPRRYFQEFKCA